MRGDHGRGQGRGQGKRGNRLNIRHGVVLEHVLPGQKSGRGGDQGRLMAV
jgi:hypothetical protein